MAARRKRAEEKVITIRRASLFAPKQRVRKTRHCLTISNAAWEHLDEIIANGDATSKSNAIEVLVADHKECYRDLKLRFSDDQKLRDFVRFCARKGELPSTWLSRKIADAMAEEISD